MAFSENLNFNMKAAAELISTHYELSTMHTFDSSAVPLTSIKSTFPGSQTQIPQRIRKGKKKMPQRLKTQDTSIFKSARFWSFSLLNRSGIKLSVLEMFQIQNKGRNIFIVLIQITPFFPIFVQKFTLLLIKLYT